VAASDLPLGPSSNEAMAGIHFTWKNEIDNVKNAAYFLYNHLYEEFRPRVHWGKLSPILTQK
jgi:hypothetical protein